MGGNMNPKNALPTTSVLQKQGIRANLNICATIIICGLIELVYFYSLPSQSPKRYSKAAILSFHSTVPFENY